MTLVVEDGTGKPDANSYLAVDEVDSLLEGSPLLTYWNARTDKEALLESSTAQLDLRWRFYGQSLTSTQARQWPRTRNYDDQGNIIPPGTIPKQIKLATATLAGMYAADPDALDDLFEGALPIKAFSTDGLSLTFGDPGGAAGALVSGEQILGPRYANLELLLRSIGTRKDALWLGPDATSVIRS